MIGIKATLAVCQSVLRLVGLVLDPSELRLFPSIGARVVRARVASCVP